MSIYKCSLCGWEYDEAEGLDEEDIAPGTKFEDLGDDFHCPRCGVDKSHFEKVN